VLRTRLRQGSLPDGTIKYNGLRQAIRLIYKEEGMTAFYSGMTAHLMRVVPNSAIMFFCYEVLVYTFHHSSYDTPSSSAHKE
jgi:solute carrier family 25, member 33/36